MKIREALIRLMEAETPASAGRCNCENLNCDHGEKACPRPAGKRKAMYVGALCDQCVSKMPAKYMQEADDEEETKPLGANPLEPKAAATGQAMTRPLGATSVTARPQMAAGPEAQKGLTMPAYQKNKQPGKPPPPSKNKQAWDMTQDFLKQHGMNLRGQKVAPTKVSGGPGGDVGPGYPGKFVGQVWDTSKVVPKNVSWTDKASGERKYGKVQGKGVNRMVWDGQAWVTDDEFTKKFGKKAEEAVRECFIREMIEANFPWSKFDPDKQPKGPLHTQPTDTDHSTDAKLGFGDAGEGPISSAALKQKDPNAYALLANRANPDKFVFDKDGRFWFAVPSEYKSLPDVKRLERATMVWDAEQKKWFRLTPTKNEATSWRTSEEFLEDNPSIDQSTASQILIRHGLKLNDYFLDNPSERNAPKIDTENLLGWMGY